MENKKKSEVRNPMPAAGSRQSAAIHQLPPEQDATAKADADFEMAAAIRFFPEDLYTVLHSTHDYSSDAKRYIRSLPDPGLRFEIRSTKENFWVECKYRENKSESDVIPVFSDGQLEKYQSLENSFLFLCVKSKDEHNNYFIPFHHISENNLNFSFIEPYRLNYGLGVRPGMIHKYLRLENTNPVIRF